MADAFVDLQHHLVGREHQVARVGRTFFGAEQFHRLFADADAVIDHALFIHRFQPDLPTARAHAAVGARLHHRAVLRHRHRAGSDDEKMLVDVGAIAGHIKVIAVDDARQRVGRHDLVGYLEQFAGFEQPVVDVAGAHRAVILFEWRLIAAAGRRTRRFGETMDGVRRGGFGHRQRFFGRRLHRSGVDAAGRLIGELAIGQHFDHDAAIAAAVIGLRMTIAHPARGGGFVYIAQTDPVGGDIDPPQ